MAHHFQVNLRGIIELLSNHLYSGPEVFLRELLQNAADAIRAREKLQPEFHGEICLELVRQRANIPSTLVMSENGIGLTEDEIHRFLATIGESSKRGLAGERLADFIGQFGIGLLSCFMVSDEIVVVTRSARDEDASTMEWRGKADGTYTVKKLDTSMSPGTQVSLTCKEGSEEFFEPGRLEELARNYGGLLSYPIGMTCRGVSACINAEPPPWKQSFSSPRERTEALLAYGYEVFGERFFDAIPLDLENEGMDGVAFVLGIAPNMTAKQCHRIYLKDMFLVEGADHLLPPWAFFVKLVVNTTKLKPVASREGFQEDAAFRKTREALSGRLRRYLFELAQQEPEKLIRLIAIHELTIKALAVADDEFYRIVFDWLPIETSEGMMTLGEYRSRHKVLRYTPTLDRFRQIAQVAAAQQICVINAGYTYVSELLEKFSRIFGKGRIERLEPKDVIDAFADLTEDERELTEDVLRQADNVLRPFRCRTKVRKFAPTDFPVLYTTSAEGQFLRSVQQSKDLADPLWSSVLDNIAPQIAGGGAFSELCFNFENRMIRKLLFLKNREVLRRSIQMLYVQSLLLGHHPLNSRELRLLNEGLLSLIELAVNTVEEGR